MNLAAAFCLPISCFKHQSPLSWCSDWRCGGTWALTFYLHEVELVNGLQQRAVVQTQVEVRGHPGSERAFPPLVLSQVHSPYEGVRNLIASKTTV